MSTNSLSMKNLNHLIGRCYKNCNDSYFKITNIETFMTQGIEIASARITTYTLYGGRLYIRYNDSINRDADFDFQATEIARTSFLSIIEKYI